MLKTHQQFIDNTTSVMSIVIPLFTLPQAIKIFVEQNAEGVSLLTWSILCSSNHYLASLWNCSPR